MADPKPKRKRGQRGPTKRAKGEGAIFKRADGVWVARLDLGFDNDGEKIRIQRTSKEKDKAVEKLRKLRDDIEQHGFSPAGAMTVAEWLTYWLSDVLRVRPSTHKLYAGVVNNHIIPAIGKRRLSGSKNQLEARHVREMLKAMEKKKLTSSRRLAFIVLNRALQDAKAENKVTRVVTDPPMKAPTPLKGEREALSTAEARAALMHAAKTDENGELVDRLGPLWATYILGGVRRGEGLGLEVDRVLLDHKVLDVSWQLQRIAWRHGCGDGPDGDGRWPCGKKQGGACKQREIDAHADFEYRQLHGGLYLVRPKSDKGRRFVPMVPSLRSSLEKRLEAYESERKAYTKDLGLLFARPDGLPYDPNVITRQWDATATAAGIRDIDIHSLRHTTGTLLLESGADVHIVEAVLGHAAVETTRGYQHVGNDLAMATMVRMEKLLELEG